MADAFNPSGVAVPLVAFSNDAWQQPGGMLHLPEQAGVDAASTLMQMAALIKPECLMEVSAVAVIPEDRIS